jgi:hypothetical protein
MSRGIRMSETIMNTKAFPEILFKLIPTEKVRVKESNGVVQLIPVDDNFDSTFGLRGMFAEFEDMAVDKFLERKRLDKELEQ